MYHVKVDPTDTSPTTIPIVDLRDIDNNSKRRVEVVDQVRSACHEWGFFQEVNHGFSVEVLDEMLRGIRGFHEQDGEERKRLYSRDNEKRVRYFSSSETWLPIGGTPSHLWRSPKPCSNATSMQF
ncbi:1-aminocyclopropane-1-carboxylate oxidase-like protein, partial [Mucuna pruriens]